MRDGIIYVRDNARRHEARDVIDWLQLDLNPGDSATLPEICQIIERRAEAASFDPGEDEKEEA